MEATDTELAPPHPDEERVRQSRVLRAASHDIRGPLANVRSYASLLADPRLELPEKARRAIAVITRNADRALLLLREFIDSEQAARGLLELPPQTVALRPALDKALRGAAPLLEERRVAVEVEERLQLAVEAEPMALEHVLRVLLENAAERSGEDARIAVVIGAAGKEAWVQVIDRGPALDAEAQRSLFDRDAHLAQRAKLSTGFRLSLAATEARVMGGSLQVRSSTTQTCFELRLPAAPA